MSDEWKAGDRAIIRCDPDPLKMSGKVVTLIEPGYAYEGEWTCVMDGQANRCWLHEDELRPLASEFRPGDRVIYTAQSDTRRGKVLVLVSREDCPVTGNPFWTTEENFPVFEHHIARCGVDPRFRAGDLVAVELPGNPHHGKRVTLRELKGALISEECFANRPADLYWMTDENIPVFEDLIRRIPAERSAKAVTEDDLREMWRGVLKAVEPAPSVYTVAEGALRWQQADPDNRLVALRIEGCGVRVQFTLKPWDLTKHQIHFDMPVAAETVHRYLSEVLGP